MVLETGVMSEFIFLVGLVDWVDFFNGGGHILGEGREGKEREYIVQDTYLAMFLIDIIISLPIA